MFLPHPRVKVSIVGSLRDREVACSATDRQGSNFESCVWRKESSQSSHHPQEVLLAQFSLYVHKGGHLNQVEYFTPWPVEPEWVLSSPSCAAAVSAAAVSAAARIPFGYYTSMVQQIGFIIHTNIQPLPAIFLPTIQVLGQKSKSKIEKFLVNAITWKIITGFSLFFTES